MGKKERGPFGFLNLSCCLKSYYISFKNCFYHFEIVIYKRCYCNKRNRLSGILAEHAPIKAVDCVRFSAGDTENWNEVLLAYLTSCSAYEWVVPLNFFQCSIATVLYPLGSQSKQARMAVTEQGGSPKGIQKRTWWNCICNNKGKRFSGVMWIKYLFLKYPSNSKRETVLLSPFQRRHCGQ